MRHVKRDVDPTIIPTTVSLDQRGRMRKYGMLRQRMLVKRLVRKKDKKEETEELLCQKRGGWSFKAAKKMNKVNDNRKKT